VFASRVLARAVAAAARRPVAVLAFVALIGAAGAFFALRLHPDAATSTLVDADSSTYKATQRYHQRFGDDAVIILVRGSLRDLVLSQDIERLAGLEGCIAGNVPRGARPYGGARSPCAGFARTKPAKVVYGPGTFVNEAVAELDQQIGAQSAAETAQEKRAATAAYRLARGKGMSPGRARELAASARKLVRAQFTTQVMGLALKYGLRSYPRLNDPAFVSSLVFDPTKPAGTPKARFAYLFPTSRSALIQVRLRPDLSEASRDRAIALIRSAVRMPDWKLRNGGTFVVTGAPVVVADLTDSISRSILILLVAGLGVMALTLALVFRRRLRLLPLAVAVVAAALTFGALSLAGAGLTMAAIGVLPVLLGLAVDYAIQFQARVEEEAGGGSLGAAAPRAAERGAPTIAAAAAATAAGFLALLLSPVPMVRSFGLLLVLGILLAFALALSAGTAMLTLADRPRTNGRFAAAARRAGASLAAAGRGAYELVGLPRVVRAVAPRAGALAARARAGGGRTLVAASTSPGRVLAIAFVLAAAGWGLETQTKVESDVQKLVPQDLSALRDLRALQRSSGVGGEIDVMVQSHDLTDPAAVRWMTSYQQSILRRFGYGPKRSCGHAVLCPAFSLPDLFNTGSAAAQSAQQTSASIKELLDAIPPYLSRGVVTPDRTVATLAFGIRLMPLDKQQRVIETMRRELDPPPGVRADLVGLPVVAAQANRSVAATDRRFATLLAGLLAVALVLLAVFRTARRALVPLIPIALATGWSSLLLFCIRIPLNPMSVTLGALVIAISTEFSVLLSERYRQEREAGFGPSEALQRTYRSTGAAVTASGVTAIAGFAVLMVSDIRMLRDFGLVTVVDLTVALLGVTIVLPSVLVLAEQGALGALSRRARTGLGRVRLRPRRAPTA
jgi:hydrophobe/amphiphile efflux-3 (HAE3) family protein